MGDLSPCDGGDNGDGSSVETDNGGCYVATVGIEDREGQETRIGRDRNDRYRHPNRGSHGGEHQGGAERSLQHTAMLEQACAVGSASETP
ncbi:MAG: hypothetical protein ACRD0G_18625 [Acidimicrobiales bacterium]